MDQGRKSTIKIIVATHKKYWMPEDSMYIPLQVGSECADLDLGYAHDNLGGNISSLNDAFCELTGLYWAWKNVDADYIGLVHYRRHFSIAKAKKTTDCVLTYEQIKSYLGNKKIFVPKKRRYFIESLKSHYSHTHYEEHLDKTRTIIEELYPDYLDSYNKVIKHRYGYMFNMMIMQRKLLDEYCEWLFNILFELQKRVNVDNLSKYQKRYLGRVSEILFNVWLDFKLKAGDIYKKDIKELGFVYMEKINWTKKGISFLKAKFLKNKYESSF